MADRVVLHVGTMKSGTTSLQAQLFANQDALAARGLLVPGRVWGDQARAVTEVARTWRADGPLWQGLVAEVAAWDGAAVISMEYLGPFEPPQVAAVVDSLAPARVEVVLTVRDLNRNLVSMWQETVQNGRGWTWTEYATAVRRSRPGGLWPPRPPRPRPLPEAGRTFWRQQDAVAMARSWGAAVGPDAVTLVTVPPRGAAPGELTARFARAVGFAAEGLAPGAPANPALGVVSSVLLQRVNAVLAADGIGLRDGKRFRKRIVAKEVLGGRSGEPRLGLAAAPWVRSYAEVASRRLAAATPRVEGDWSDLRPLDVAGTDPATVADEALTPVAHDAFVVLRDRLSATPSLSATGPATAPALPAWPRDPSPEEAVAALAGLVAAGVRAGVPA